MIEGVTQALKPTLRGLSGARTALLDASSAASSGAAPDAVAAHLQDAAGALTGAGLNYGPIQRGMLKKASIDDVTDLAASISDGLAPADAVAAIDQLVMRAHAEVAWHVRATNFPADGAIPEVSIWQHARATRRAIAELGAAKGRLASDYPTANPQRFQQLKPDGRRYDEAGADAANALATDVRADLAATFGPLEDDLIRNARSLRRTSLDQIRLRGDDAVVIRSEQSPQQFVRAGEGRGFDALTVDQYEARDTLRSAQDRTRQAKDIAVRLPVSAYGASLTRAISKASRAMMALAEDRLSLATDAVSQRNSAVLKRWSFHQADALGTMQEGVLSHAQALALLTAHKVPGRSAEALLDELRDGRAVNQLALSPLGLVASLANHGAIPRSILERGAHGRLALSQDMRTLYGGMRSSQQLGEVPSPATGTGCPLAAATLNAADGGRESYVMRLNDEFINLTKRYLREERKRTGS